MDKLYNPNADAYCGDEDNGQTSAWYVFSAMGFYPVCPGSNEYALGSPLFRSVKVKLENGKTLTIEAPDNAPEKRYVDKVKMSGKTITRNYVTHEELLGGPTLRFGMSAKPNTERGTKAGDVPYSLSK